MWILTVPVSPVELSAMLERKRKGEERKTQEAERDHRVKEGRRLIDDKGMGSQAM